MTLKKRKLSRLLTILVPTLSAAILLSLFLSTFVYMLFSALKTKEQVSELGAPIWPAGAATFAYDGKEYDVYNVPTGQGMKKLALFKKGLQESTFIDPANPGAGPIQW